MFAIKHGDQLVTLSDTLGTAHFGRMALMGAGRHVAPLHITYADRIDRVDAVRHGSTYAPRHRADVEDEWTGERVS